MLDLVSYKIGKLSQVNGGIMDNKIMGVKPGAGEFSQAHGGKYSKWV